MNKMDIVPTSLVINAMRDSGYKNAAYSIAELMDNAIQAGASTVELLCAERKEMLKQRAVSRIYKIAVLDNGEGMNQDVLEMALQFGNGTRLQDRSGIGRFGMGLPNSSISQARRVDVWSWQDSPDKSLHTYLDVDEIDSGKLRYVPTPALKPIPQVWRTAGTSFGASGTLVVWSNLDRIMWRTARAVVDNSEFLIGRMYRYFLHDASVKIRFATFGVNSSGDTPTEIEERFARANDPLYLLANTSCPEPYDDQPMFTQGEYEDTVFVVRFRDTTHNVKVRFAYAKEEARPGHNPGAKPHGKHAARNAGVSIVRANRELDLDTAWTDPSQPRDRWWGVEVAFPPELDDLFGLTNNKQSARNFTELARLDLEDLVTPGQTYGAMREELDADEDPRLPLFEIAQHIRRNIRTLRRLIEAQTATETKQRHAQGQAAEEKGTEVTRKRIDEGFVSDTDKQEAEVSIDDRTRAIEEELVHQGATAAQAGAIAAQTVGRGLKYTLTKSTLASPAFFDVQSRGGAIIVGLNVEHPAYEHLIEVLRDGDMDKEDLEVLQQRLTQARDGLELLLMAWARFEDEQPAGSRRDRARDARWDWGRMAREFLEE